MDTKKSEYEKITIGFMISKIGDLCCLLALIFNNICENDAINTDTKNNMI
nr:hypothetical protein [Sporanaerobium hydrogeniformans]